MLDDFMIRAALGAVGTATAAGLLGCFVVWRRMAYFGDATAHAAVLGVAMSLAFGTGVIWGVILVSVLVAVLIHTLSADAAPMETLLGVVSHGALAIGLVAVSLVPGQRVDLDAYLFGEVLTVTRTDLAVIWLGALAVALVIWRHWQALLTATLSPDLAYAAGVDPRREQLILTLLLAIVVAVAIKVVGALLITALLIIPAATARSLTRTPEAMAVVAILIGTLCALGGLRAAIVFNTPVGPSIVCVAALLFTLATISRKLFSSGS